MITQVCLIEEVYSGGYVRAGAVQCCILSAALSLTLTSTFCSSRLSQLDTLRALDTWTTSGYHTHTWNMNSFRLGLVFLYCIVSLQLCGCTSLDGGSNPAVTAKKLRLASTGGQTQNNDTRTDDHLQDSNEEYISAEYEDDDTRVSTKSKDSTVTAIKGQGKGKAKENPCLTEKYRHYCIHGVCRYLAELNHTSCICETGYSGDRCHLFILPVGKEAEGNSHTTALAVMAAGLSLMCFTVIGVLLALRFQKKSDTSTDEKIRLQLLHSDEEKAKDTNQWFSGQNGYHPETPCPC